MGFRKKPMAGAQAKPGDRQFAGVERRYRVNPASAAR
jgi:hypothetical protein